MTHTGFAVHRWAGPDVVIQRSPLEDTSDATELRIASRLRGSEAHVVPMDPAQQEIPMDWRKIYARSSSVGGPSTLWGYLTAAGAPICSPTGLQAHNLAQPRRRMPAGQTLLSLAVLRGVTRAIYESQALALRRQAISLLDTAFTAAQTEVLVSVANTHSSLYATAGYPAVTIPAGLRRNGMPTGITLIGRSGSDAWLMGLAAAVEATP